jgi:hypothetical protein
VTTDSGLVISELNGIVSKIVVVFERRLGKFARAACDARWCCSR